MIHIGVFVCVGIVTVRLQAQFFFDWFIINHISANQIFRANQTKWRVSECVCVCVFGGGGGGGFVFHWFIWV